MLGGFGIINLAMVAVCSTSLPHQEFEHSEFLDHDGSFRMLWTPTEEKITIEVQVATRGYAGLGFSPSGGMTGADMVMGWVDELGNVDLHDLYGVGNTKPHVDPSQDYTLLGGYQNDTHTVLRFSRPWTTCDAEHDLQLTSDTTRVIWAFNDVDPNGFSSDMVVPAHNYHARNRGTKSLYLQKPKNPDTFSEDLQFWDLTAPNVELPEGLDTLYWCGIFKIPNLKKKNHVVGYTPLIRPASHFKYVHHMMLNMCHFENIKLDVDQFVVGKGVQCYSANFPLSWLKCSTPLAVWAVGSDGEFIPDHVGLPLGKEYGGADYYMLEIHYDNSFLDNGIVDTSGLRVYHTDHLREHDAGLLKIGPKVSAFHIIPPGVKEWTTAGHCSAECLNTRLPSTGINVTYGLLHMHFLGRGISLRQIRDGKELPRLLKDDNYVFDYQVGRPLKPEMQILPGDQLIAECIYDSSLRKKPTFGGFSTRDEMCLVVLTYYPKTNLGLCQSSPSAWTLMQPLGIEGFYPQQQKSGAGTDRNVIENNQLEIMLDNKTLDTTELTVGKFLKQVVVKEPPELANVSWYDILNDESIWTSDLLRTFQNAVKMGQHKNRCLTTSHTPITDGVPTYIEYPHFEPYVPPKPTCNNDMDRNNL